MPSPIPVRIAERDFRSLNQARLHYCGILHSYQPGQSVSEEHGQQVSDLVTSSGAAMPRDSDSALQVVKGNYGRRCFANVVREKGTHMISITRAVKLCVAPAPITKAVESPALKGRKSPQLPQPKIKEINCDPQEPTSEH